MALTKIGKEGITGVSNAANATFLTATSAEGVTLAGTLAVTGVHTVGNNAVATSENGAVTTNITQGLAKSWVRFKGPDTFGIGDSLNVSSMDDNGVGDYTITILNDFSSVNYSMTATGYKPSAQHGFITNNNINFITAATARIETVEHDGGHKETEFEASCVTFHGDLL